MSRAARSHGLAGARAAELGAELLARDPAACSRSDSRAPAVMRGARGPRRGDADAHERRRRGEAHWPDADLRAPWLRTAARPWRPVRRDARRLARCARSSTPRPDAEDRSAAASTRRDAARSSCTKRRRRLGLQHLMQRRDQHGRCAAGATRSERGERADGAPRRRLDQDVARPHGSARIAAAPRLCSRSRTVPPSSSSVERRRILEIVVAGGRDLEEQLRIEAPEA